MKSCFDSEYYDEISPNGAKSFFAAILFTPFVLLGKLVRTIFKTLIALFGLVALFPTLGHVSNRTFFIEKVSNLAADLADWIVFPFALSRYLFRCVVSKFRNQRV